MYDPSRAITKIKSPKGCLWQNHSSDKVADTLAQIFDSVKDGEAQFC